MEEPQEWELWAACLDPCRCQEVALEELEVLELEACQEVWEEWGEWVE
jgi:hypothetical protein